MAPIPRPDAKRRSTSAVGVGANPQSKENTEYQAVPMMRIFLRPMVSASQPAGMTEITIPRVDAIASSPTLKVPS